MIPSFEICSHCGAMVPVAVHPNGKGGCSVEGICSQCRHSVCYSTGKTEEMPVQKTRVVGYRVTWDGNDGERSYHGQKDFKTWDEAEEYSDFIRTNPDLFADILPIEEAVE